MGEKLPNPRLIKIHRNYSTEEIAGLFGLHKNTVRRWERDGLKSIDDRRRPKLFLGVDVRAHLEAKRKRTRQQCPPGFLYCFGCRRPTAPVGNCVALLPQTAHLASLRATCSCGTLMYRRVSKRTLPIALDVFTVTLSEECSRLGGSPSATSVDDLHDTWRTYANSQR